MVSSSSCRASQIHICGIINIRIAMNYLSIPTPRTQDSGSHKQKFPWCWITASGFQISLHRETSDVHICNSHCFSSQSDITIINLVHFSHMSRLVTIGIQLWRWTVSRRLSRGIFEFLPSFENRRTLGFTEVTDTKWRGTFQTTHDRGRRS